MCITYVCYISRWADTGFMAGSLYPDFCITRRHCIAIPWYFGSFQNTYYGTEILPNDYFITGNTWAYICPPRPKVQIFESDYDINIRSEIFAVISFTSETEYPKDKWVWEHMTYTQNKNKGKKWQISSHTFQNQKVCMLQYIHNYYS